jgi:hypothetical protein
MGACFPEWLMINQFRPAYSVLLPKARKQSSLGEIDAAIKRFGLNRLPSWRMMSAEYQRRRNKIKNK